MQIWRPYAEGQWGMGDRWRGDEAARSGEASHAGCREPSAPLDQARTGARGGYSLREGEEERHTHDLNCTACWARRCFDALVCPRQ